jgi:Short C-terminal domain
MSGRFAPRVAITVSILTLVVSVIGFVAVMILDAFVLDEFDAYGEVPIPGSASLQLPEGEVMIRLPHLDHWSARVGKKARPLGPQELLTFTEPTWSAGTVPAQPAASYTPTDQGIRIEQLKTLVALRDSGALTDEEFEAEKRRILET